MSIDIPKPNLGPFKKIYAHHFVSETIKENILSGAYRPGDQIPTESELWRELGVSRSAIREGLSELEGAGLIETTQGAKGGRFVKKITSDSIYNGLELILNSKKATYEQILEARKVIECSTAKLASLMRTEEDLGKMENLIKLKAETKEEFVKLNYKFHEHIAFASKNMILYYMVQAIRKILFSTYDLITYEEMIIDWAQDCHWAIFNAIKTSNPEDAEKAMINDLEAYGKIYLEYINKHLR